MSVVDEIINDPSLVTKLCELTSSMSLALAVSKIRSQQAEIDELKTRISNLHQDHKATREKLDKVADFVRQMSKRREGV